MKSPKFLYFDLGMVLVRFSIDRMCRQMGQVAGIDAQRVREALFARPLHTQYEMGEISTEGYYQDFCQATGARPDFRQLCRAASEIFELNYAMLPVVAQLHAAGWRMGILSNTCQCHWEYLLETYRVLEQFPVFALSFEIRAAKPERAIFQAAAEMAGVAAEEIFFTDDIAGHVAGARAAGLDAVLYTSTPELVTELHKRGVQFNF